MSKYTKEELEKTLQIVASVIKICEKAQTKFAQGASQYTLLKNRIKALYISELLLSDKDITDKYTNEELLNAIKPVCSIISKCDKARIKFEKGCFNYSRFEKMIMAMNISKYLIEDEINKRTKLI